MISFLDPIIVGLRTGQAQAANVLRGDVDAGGKKHLLLHPFFLEVVKTELHVVAGDLARRDLAVAPVDLGIVNIWMAVRRAALRIAWVEGMDPLGVVVSAVAGFLGRKARVGLRQVVNFIHEIPFPQMRIEIDNHKIILLLGFGSLPA